MKKKEMSESALKKWLSNRKQVIVLAGDAISKAKSVKLLIKEIWIPIKTMAEILLSWAKGEYAQLPWRSLAAIAGAILYFVNPLDVIPDILGAAGYIDDIFVVRKVWLMIQQDVLLYNDWKNQRPIKVSKL